MVGESQRTKTSTGDEAGSLARAGNHETHQKMDEPAWTDETLDCHAIRCHAQVVYEGKVWTSQPTMKRLATGEHVITRPPGI